MNYKSIVLVLLVVIMWGVNFSIIKIGLEELPPILFSALRFAVVAIPAILFIPFPKTSILNVIGVGLFLGILQFSFLFVAMEADASAGLSSLILQTQVLFTIILSSLIYKEKVSKSQSFGIIVAVIGFSFFFYSTGGNITTKGLILIVCAAFFWAVSNVIMKRIGSINLLHFMVWVSVVPPIPLLFVSYFLESQEPISLLMATTERTWLSVLFVSYISTLIGFAIWGWLLKNNTAATVTPFALLIPVVGIITSSILLGESLSIIEIIGTGLIMLGLLFCVVGKRIYSYFKATSSQLN
ncbi:EamA family transporter [Psychromonas sp. SP041]|uniref:EamA family transporter n=1 Tax=Psychromonas sp. SP041 TaxID=1365007 RepID=UPI0010C7B916|nr:EamA family transporter [Psychromonas sp. SP041]